jgi:hypothetical protein
MAALFGAKKSGNEIKPAYTSLQLQTSAYGTGIVIPYGRNVVAPNIIWYNDFKIHASSKKAGKGGGSSKVTSYTYSVACLLGLSEGPIFGIEAVWVNQSQTTLAALNLTPYTGTNTQTPFGFVTTKYPAQALNYRYVAYLATGFYNLQTSGSLPTHRVEIRGFLSDTQNAYSSYSVNMADVAEDFLLNTRYGVGLDPVYLGDLDQYRDYCQAYRLWMSPFLGDLTPVAEILDNWAQLTNSWIFWSGEQIKFVPLGDENRTAYGATYTAEITARYNLTLDDFLWDDGESPIRITVKDPADAPNHSRLDMSSPAKAYETLTLEWKDQASIEKFGLVTGNTIKGEAITEQAVGQTVLDLIASRFLFIRKKYEFSLGPSFILLEVGDIVTLTDPTIPLYLFPVRIFDIKETEQGQLKIEAEEFPSGVASPGDPLSTTADGSGPPDFYSDPQDVNTPMILEPFGSLTNGNPQIWVGLSGSTPEWGGANIWVSLDGVNYQNIGTVSNPATQGVLTANLADASGIDTVNTLSIDLTMSGTSLAPGATNDDADQGRTLSLVGDELLAYGDLVVTGTNLYDMTYLNRGLYDTTHAAHLSGTAFCRLDDAVFKYDLPEEYVGELIYLKFTSFNTFGQAEQDISVVTEYTFTPVGSGYYIGAPSAVTITPVRTLQADGATVISLEGTWTASSGPLLGGYDVRWSSDGGVTWINSAAGAGATSTTFQPAIPSTDYLLEVRARSKNGTAVSAYVSSTLTSSGNLNSAAPTAPANLTVTSANAIAILDWDPNSSSEGVFRYRVHRSVGPGGAFGTAVAQWEGTADNYNQVGLTPGDEWTYFVTAINGTGESSPSTGVDVTVANVIATSAPFDIPMSYVGVPTGSMVYYRALLARAITMPNSLTGSYATCEVAPTSNYTISINRIVGSTPTLLGTITWLAAATTGTFSFSGPVTLSAGDILELVGQSSADPTFENPSVTLATIR